MIRREYPEGPVVGVGALVVKDRRILLVKRGVEPSRGLWSIPGGTLELGETLKAGAERETLEETGIVIEAGEPVYVFDFFERDHEGRIRFHFVIVDLWGKYQSGEAKEGDDADAVCWADREDLKGLAIGKNTRRLLEGTGFLK